MAAAGSPTVGHHACVAAGWYRTAVAVYRLECDCCRLSSFACSFTCLTTAACSRTSCCFWATSYSTSLPISPCCSWWCTMRWGKSHGLKPQPSGNTSVPTIAGKHPAEDIAERLKLREKQDHCRSLRQRFGSVPGSCGSTALASHLSRKPGDVSQYDLHSPRRHGRPVRLEKIKTTATAIWWSAATEPEPPPCRSDCRLCLAIQPIP